MMCVCFFLIGKINAYFFVEIECVAFFCIHKRPPLFLPR